MKFAASATKFLVRTTSRLITIKWERRRSRIVIRPKNVEKLFVASLRRVEFNFDNFGVARLIRAHILVARILFCAASITDCGRSDAFQFPESFFHAPETTGTECRFFYRH